MRLNEIICETERDAESDVLDLLIAARASGVTSINTDLLLKQVKRMGHGLDVESLLALLNDLDVVQSATFDKVNLAGFFEPPDPDKEEQDQERVKQLATKLAKKRIEQ